MSKFTQNNYNGMSGTNKYFSNVQDSFSQNKPLIERQEYVNTGNILHNNLAENLLSENVFEYNIYIDSADRDISKYYSPFEFKVYFSEIADYPKIDQNFKNVKYINLNYIILPPTNVLFANNTLITDLVANVNYGLFRGNYLTFSSNNQYKYPTTTTIIPSVPTLNPGVKWPIQTNPITTNKYLILKIKELDNLRVKSTSENNTSGIDKNSFVLFYDDDVNDSAGNNTGSIWKTKFGGGSRVFLSSELKNINSFTICIYDQFGNKIIPVDNTIPSTNNPEEDITNTINLSPNDGKGILMFPYTMYDNTGKAIYPYNIQNNSFSVDNGEIINCHYSINGKTIQPYNKQNNSFNLDNVGINENGGFTYKDVDTTWYFDSAHQQPITPANIAYYTNNEGNFATNYAKTDNTHLGYTQSKLNTDIQTYNLTKPNIKNMALYFEQNYNMQLGFTFGVVENELNTLTKYSR